MFTISNRNMFIMHIEYLQYAKTVFYTFNVAIVLWAYQTYCSVLRRINLHLGNFNHYYCWLLFQKVLVYVLLNLLLYYAVFFFKVCWKKKLLHTCVYNSYVCFVYLSCMGQLLLHSECKANNFKQCSFYYFVFAVGLWYKLICILCIIVFVMIIPCVLSYIFL